ncbi:MAG: DNA-formamidopyrimidine glycosylase [Candidatus Falkowbacteria bacterium]|nr:DNA-formamidopyrimidine glycosylase [Candidatus Falkowbacteria bacterium]
MPELPEVQTVISDLNQKIIGKQIVDFWSLWENGIKLPLDQFKKNMVGARIILNERIGKHIIVHLDNNYSIVMHLKMTGHLLLKESNDNNIYFNDRVNQYVRHIFYLLDTESQTKFSLEFSDLRKFGWINLVETDAVRNLTSIQKLGTDALVQDLNKFLILCDRSNKSKIGIFLLDQAKISGIGNIYRSEILYEASIYPLRLVSDLNKEEKEVIFRAIKKVLNLAIELRGTSDSDYRDTAGMLGGFQKVLKVYRRENKPCLNCGLLIKRFKLAQRSVFYCEKCQN